MRIERDETSGVLTIAGVIDIGSAEELLASLAETVAREPEPALDLSQVESCDTAALQLLISAARSVERRDKRLRLVGAAPAVEETAAVLGLRLEDLTGAGQAKRGEDGGL